MEERIPLKILGITASEVQRGAYALVLSDESGERRIPVIIGTAEAQSIAVGLERLVPGRPLTHDLFVSLLHGFGIELKEAFIYRFDEGVFRSELIFEDAARQVTVDARTSDAVALALRVGAPLYTTPEILHAAGVLFEEGPESEPAAAVASPVSEKEPQTFAAADEAELRRKLDRAERERAYELASRIQRELKKRFGAQ